MEKIICGYCKKGFRSEKTLFAHACEFKRRYLAKDEKETKIAFLAWKKFNELNRIMIKKNVDEFEQFINSRGYIGFIKFAKSVKDLQPLDTDKFIIFLIKNAVPLKKWYSFEIYKIFVREHIGNESPKDAIERNIKLIQSWASETNNNWNDFFDKINTNIATNWIMSGKISPWLIFCSKNSDKLLSRFDEKQSALVQQFIEPAAWKIKMTKNKQEVEYISKILSEVNL